MKTCLWIGTYTCPVVPGGDEAEYGNGIYVYSFDVDSGRAALRSVYEECRNPSYLSVSGDMLYAVSELAPDSLVSALRYHAEDGTLSRVNEMTVPGAAACHVEVWKEKDCLAVANYLSGSVGVYSLNQDGSIGGENAFFQYDGRGADSKRQEGPHAHSSIVSPDGRFLITADLGTDKLRHYRWDGEQGRPAPDARYPVTDTPPGEGPRHMCFSPDGRYMYLVTELKSSVICYEYEPEIGKLTRFQTLSSLPEGYEGDNIAADIHISPDGRYLYVSERGADVISVFPVNRENGRLGKGTYYLCGGKTPRNFCISPCGTYIVIANQDSGNVVIFRRHSEDGSIGELMEEIKVPSPVCVKMSCQV